MPEIQYPLDTTGFAASNLIADEQHTLTDVNSASYRIIIPQFAPFYLDNLSIKLVDPLGNETLLHEDVEYYPCLPYIGAIRSIGKMLYGGISISTNTVNGILKITYQTLGGEWTADSDAVLVRLAEMVYNPRTTVWDIVTNRPNQFPPINHDQNMDYIYGHGELIDAINNIATMVLGSPNPDVNIIRHLVNLNNPHGVTKAQLGISNVQDIDTATDVEVINKVEADKHITLRQLLQFPLTDPAIIDLISQHIVDISNPHNVTKAQIGLGNVPNLPLAGDLEVTNRDPVEKFVTLRQLINSPLTDPAVLQALNDHLTNTSNPHAVTKGQIGLNLVKNIDTATDEDISTRAEVDKHITLRQLLQFPLTDPNIIASIGQHFLDTSNPHGVTKAQVGLGNVPNLPLATDQEVFLKEELDKLITLKQLVAAIRDNNPPILTPSLYYLSNH